MRIFEWLYDKDRKGMIKDMETYGFELTNPEKFDKKLRRESKWVFGIYVFLIGMFIIAVIVKLIGG